MTIESNFPIADLLNSCNFWCKSASEQKISNHRPCILLTLLPMSIEKRTLAIIRSKLFEKSINPLIAKTIYSNVKN